MALDEDLVEHLLSCMCWFHNSYSIAMPEKLDILCVSMEIIGGTYNTSSVDDGSLLNDT